MCSLEQSRKIKLLLLLLFPEQTRKGSILKRLNRRVWKQEWVGSDYLQCCNMRQDIKSSCVSVSIKWWGNVCCVISIFNPCRTVSTVHGTCVQHTELLSTWAVGVKFQGLCVHKCVRCVSFLTYGMHKWGARPMCVHYLRKLNLKINMLPLLGFLNWSPILRHIPLHLSI